MLHTGIVSSASAWRASTKTSSDDTETILGACRSTCDRDSLIDAAAAVLEHAPEKYESVMRDLLSLYSEFMTFACPGLALSTCDHFTGKQNCAEIAAYCLQGGSNVFAAGDAK